MQEVLSGKRIIRINNHWSNNRTYSTNDYWWKPADSVYMAKNKIENANWDTQIPTVKTLPEEAKLVFHKTSKFPRHKLGLTTFKRKIKEKGADFIVDNTQTGSSLRKAGLKEIETILHSSAGLYERTETG
mgnify:CR=1 FL=1